MNLLYGKVKFNGIKPHRSLMRYVERQLEKWITRQRSLMFLPQDCRYFVEIDREKPERLFQCRLNVRIGSREWYGVEAGRDLQDALARALRHLRSSSALQHPETLTA